MSSTLSAVLADAPWELIGKLAIAIIGVLI